VRRALLVTTRPAGAVALIRFVAIPSLQAPLVEAQRGAQFAVLIGNLRNDHSLARRRLETGDARGAFQLYSRILTDLQTNRSTFGDQLPSQADLDELRAELEVLRANATDSSSGEARSHEAEEIMMKVWQKIAERNRDL
jgi:hypothetical protein